MIAATQKSANRFENGIVVVQKENARILRRIGSCAIRVEARQRDWLARQLDREARPLRRDIPDANRSSMLGNNSITNA